MPSLNKCKTVLKRVYKKQIFDWKQLSVTTQVTVDDHPLLDVVVFAAEFQSPIGELKSSALILESLNLDCDSPFQFTDEIKPKVRDLLRHGGYKPTGRGKPASEYLRQAVEKGTLNPINLPVDVCNVVSLHSGLPISVVDVEQTVGPLRIGIAPPESEYVFNATGQTIKLDGLLCLFDIDGPCANGVKDSQRTKTSESTTKTLSIVWGTTELEGRTKAAANWYCQLLESAGAKTEIICT